MSIDQPDTETDHDRAADLDRGPGGGDGGDAPVDPGPQPRDCSTRCRAWGANGGRTVAPAAHSAVPQPGAGTTHGQRHPRSGGTPGASLCAARRTASSRPLQMPELDDPHGRSPPAQCRCHGPPTPCPSVSTRRNGAILLAFLGLAHRVAPGAWPARRSWPSSSAWTADTVQQALHRARERWSRQPWMTVLREDAPTCSTRAAGCMTTHELATALLAARGSAADEARALPLCRRRCLRRSGNRNGA